MADADDVMRAIYTALSNELVRSAIRTQMQSIPRSILMEVLGVNGKQLKHFMDGGALPERLWEAGCAFDEWMAEPVEVELEAVGLNIIADTFPDWRRARVRRALVDAVLPVLRAAGRELADL